MPPFGNIMYQPMPQNNMMYPNPNFMRMPFGPNPNMMTPMFPNMQPFMPNMFPVYQNNQNNNQ